MSILSLQGVSKIYGSVKALYKVDMSVNTGEWIAIMGPSGSGKTTMMNIIGCMDRPSEGTVMLDGTDIARQSERNLTTLRREKIGLVFQQFHLVNYLSAVENIMLAQYYHSLPDEDEAMEALEQVGLADRARHLPAQLSGGEQQRVCIARALINHPSLLLADEPTGNLDEKNEELVMDIFSRLHSRGSTIIVVTHDPEVAEQADRMIVLEHGKLVRDVLQEHKRREGRGDRALPERDARPARPAREDSSSGENHGKQEGQSARPARPAREDSGSKENPGRHEGGAV